MEVLRNKERDFNVKPNAKGGTDSIEESENRVNFQDQDTVVVNGQKCVDLRN